MKNQIQTNGLMIVICNGCHNPLVIPEETEGILLNSDVLDCPICEHQNEINEELKDYVLATTGRRGEL